MWGFPLVNNVPDCAVESGSIVIHEICRVVTKREAVELFRKASKDIPPELRHAPPDAETHSSQTHPSQSEVDREIIETLRAVGHRLTTTKLLGEMSRRKLNPSASYVKKRLAELVKAGRVTNDPNAGPKGYGLPEWPGSFGSSGSGTGSGN
jgi:hypothetical protein